MIIYIWFNFRQSFLIIWRWNWNSDCYYRWLKSRCKGICRFLWKLDCRNSWYLSFNCSWGLKFVFHFSFQNLVSLVLKKFLVVVVIPKQCFSQNPICPICSSLIDFLFNITSGPTTFTDSSFDCILFNWIQFPRQFTT